MENNQQNNALSIGGWIGSLIVLAIPVVGFVMLFVWGFGSGDKGRKNFCVAALILAAICIVISVIIGIIFGFAFLSIFSEFAEFY